MQKWPAFTYVQTQVMTAVLVTTNLCIRVSTKASHKSGYGATWHRPEIREGENLSFVCMFLFFLS